MRALHQRSGGVPRLINIIADRALAGGYTADKLVVGLRLIHMAADEVQPGDRQVQSNRWPWVFAGGAAAVLVVALAVFAWPLSNITSAISPPPMVTAQAPALQTEPVQIARPEDPAIEVADGSEGGQAAVIEAAGDPEEIPVAAIQEETEPEATLEAPWLDKQHALVWHGLAALWGDAGQAEAIRSACDGQNRTGFACMHSQGNWSRISRLGLPALLVLQTDRSRYVLLQGISETQVQLGAGEDSRWLPRDLVEEYWLGRYLVAWPQAPGWPAEIHRGQTGQAVDIVLELARQAELPWTGGVRFDPEFENWLKRFQSRHGLEPDGIVGPVTLLHLMAPTIERPRLASRNEQRLQES
jgi:general secretion pathway protein A